MFTSLYEYRLLVEGAERRIHREWDMTRWAVFNLTWAIPGRKIGCPRTLESMFPMPWDNDGKREIKTVEVSEREQEIVLSIFDRIKSNEQAGRSDS